MPTVSSKVSNEDFERIKKIATSYNITVSELIKQAIFSAEITDTKAITKETKSLNLTLSEIGNNVNQLTRYTHYKKQFNPLAKSGLHEIYLDIAGILNDK